MKKTNVPQWQQNSYEKPNISSLILWCIAVEILLLSGLFMLYDVFPEMKLQGSDFICLELLAFAFVLAYEIAIPLLAKKMGAVWGMVSYCVLPFVAAFGFWFYYYRHMEELNLGFFSIGNAYLDKLNPYYQVHFFLPMGVTQMISPALCFGLLLFLFLLLGFAGVSRKRRWLVLFPLLILGGEMAVGYAPGWQGVSLLFLGVLLCGAGSGCGGLTGKRQKNREKSGFQTLAVQGSLLLAATLLLALAPVLFGGAAESLMAKSDSYKTFQKDLEDTIASFSWDRLVGDRQAVSNRKPVYADRVALVVTADAKPQESLYLREFYGTEYRNGTWIQTKDDFERGCRENGIDIEAGQRYLAGAVYDYLVRQNIFGEANHIPIYSSTVGMEDDYSAYYSSFGGEDVSDINCSISYKQSMGSSALFPYYADALGEKSEELEGDFLVKKGVFTGKTEMSIADFPHEMLETLFHSILEIKDCQDNWEEEGREFFQWYNNYAADYTSGSEMVPTAEEVAQQLIDDANSAPSGWFLSYSTPGKYSSNNRYFLARATAAYLKGKCSYRLNLESDTKGKDVVEYFLSESHEGYCMHFASAGALILQEMGVPARYVSGYIVKSGNFELQEDGTYRAEVQDNCAHAWVEIYLDNLGWIPVEMTPGYGGRGTSLPSQEEEPEEPDSPLNQEGSENSQQQEASSQVTEEPEESQEEKQEDSQEKLPGKEDGSSADGPGKENEKENGGFSAWWNQYGNLFRAVFWMNMAIRLAVLLLLWGRRVIHNQIRRRYFLIRQDMGRGNYVRAVRRMNRFLYRRLFFKGRFVNRNISDEDYLKALAENYPEQTAEQWKAFVKLAQKAAYSNGDMTKEEAQAAAEIFFAACKPLQSD